MAASKIEWTDRSDWNPIRGCTRVSPGCGGPGPHGGCYAEAIAARFSDPGQAFHGFAERTKSGPRWTGKVEIQEDRLTLPLRWRKPARIFASSTSDIFHESLPDEAIDKIFAVMALAPHLTFQVVTKRSKRMREYLSARNGMGNSAICRAINLIPARFGNRHGALEMPLPNVWLGTSVEDQARADERIPDLLATPAAVRFISAEPLLGPVKLRETLSEDWLASGKSGERRGLNLVIVGGESGPKARPMHPDWARSLRNQCNAAGVPFFFKQWGEWAPVVDVDGSVRSEGAGSLGAWRSSSGWRFVERGEGHAEVWRVGKKAAGRLIDGVTHDEMPHV